MSKSPIVKVDKAFRKSTHVLFNETRRWFLCGLAIIIVNYSRKRLAFRIECTDRGRSPCLFLCSAEPSSSRLFLDILQRVHRLSFLFCNPEEKSLLLFCLGHTQLYKVSSNIYEHTYIVLFPMSIGI